MWAWKSWLTVWVVTAVWSGGYCTRNVAPSPNAGSAHTLQLVGAPSTQFSPWVLDAPSSNILLQNGAAHSAEYHLRQYLNDPSICFTVVAISQCSMTGRVYVYVQPRTRPEQSPVVNRLATAIMNAQYHLINVVHLEELTIAPILPLHPRCIRQAISKQQALQALNMEPPAATLAMAPSQVSVVLDPHSLTWASIRLAAFSQGSAVIPAWEVYVRTGNSGHSVLVDRYTSALLTFATWSHQLNNIHVIAHNLRVLPGASKYRPDLHSQGVGRLSSLISSTGLRRNSSKFTPLTMTVDEISKYASDYHFFLVGREVDMLATKVFELFHHYGWDQESMAFFDVDWLDVLAANGFVFEPVQGAPLYSKQRHNKLGVDIQYGVVTSVNLFPGSHRIYGAVSPAPSTLATDIHTLLHALFAGTLVKVVGSIQMVKCIDERDQKNLLTAFGHFFTMLMTPGLHKGYLEFYRFAPQYSSNGLTDYQLTWNDNPYQASGVFEPRVPRALSDLAQPSASSWFKMLLTVYGVLMKYLPVSNSWLTGNPLESANTLMLTIMLTSTKALPCSPTIFDVAKALLDAMEHLSVSEMTEQVRAVLKELGVVRAASWSVARGHGIYC